MVGAGVPVHVPFVAVSTWPTVVVPLIVGTPVLAGSAPAAAIAADWIVVADAVPATFVPVTTARMVVPTSPATSTYVLAVAPPMLAQLAPAASQRCHW